MLTFPNGTPVLLLQCKEVRTINPSVCTACLRVFFLEYLLQKLKCVLLIFSYTVSFLCLITDCTVTLYLSHFAAFNKASAFNSDISKWNTVNVVTMFSSTSNFYLSVLCSFFSHRISTLTIFYFFFLVWFNIMYSIFSCYCVQC